MLACLSICYVVGICFSQLFMMLVVTDVIVTSIFSEPLAVIGRCHLPYGCDMAADLCHCGRWNSHILLVLW